jgi:SAM-dependent methyltransferase
MNPEEYENLERVENAHWFYSGKRQIVAAWMLRGGKVDFDSLLADIGAGTGAFAQEMAKSCRVVAVDDYEESLAVLRRRLPPESVKSGSCTSVPIESNTCDFVTALDVLEHVEDDRVGFSELVRICKPGGTIIVTVPAMMCLWSDWDVSLHHHRRYDASSLRDLAAGHVIDVINLNYMNFWVFPMVWIVRKLRAILGATTGRSEDRIPPEFMNRILRKIFTWSSIQTTFRWPFGVGLILVARKL